MVFLFVYMFVSCMMSYPPMLMRYQQQLSIFLRVILRNSKAFKCLRNSKFQRNPDKMFLNLNIFCFFDRRTTEQLSDYEENRLQKIITLQTNCLMEINADCLTESIRNRAALSQAVLELCSGKGPLLTLYCTLIYNPRTLHKSLAEATLAVTFIQWTQQSLHPLCRQRMKKRLFNGSLRIAFAKTVIRSNQEE